MRWVEELSRPTDEVGSGDTLGIPLDETALIIFRELLHGRSETVSALRASPVFRPLFAR